jgi:methionine--tRNA ligase beta chain
MQNQTKNMDQIDVTDFAKLDIRIGTVTHAEVPEWSHWVMKLTVNLGEEVGERTIFAGIMKHYKPEELIGKQFPFVVNLKPKKIGPAGDFSEGMMLCPSVALGEGGKADEETKPVLFKLWEEVPNGTKVR